MVEHSPQILASEEKASTSHHHCTARIFCAGIPLKLAAPMPAENKSRTVFEFGEW